MLIQQMTMHRIFNTAIAIAVLSLMLGQAGFVTAQEKTNGDQLRVKAREHRTEIDTALTNFRSARGEKRLEKLKVASKRIVSVRTEALNGLIARLAESNKCKNLSEAQLSEIKAAIQSIITKLETQDSDIASSTDLTKAKTAIKEVYTNNKVFAAVIPATNGACLATRLTFLIDCRLNTLVEKIKAAGIETAEIEALMTKAKSSAEAAYTVYLGILQNPAAENVRASFSTAKSHLQTTRQELGAVKSALAKLRADYEQQTKDGS